MINTHIYYLHRGDNIPVYIGKAIKPHRRLKEHRCHKQDFDLCIATIDIVKDWKYWEEFYIELFTSWGFELENQTKKGRGPGPRPCKWGNKISKSLKGNKYSKQQKHNCKNGHRRVFYQYDLEGNFIKKWFCSARDIGKHFNKCPSNLTKFFRGRQKSAFGFIWRTE